MLANDVYQYLTTIPKGKVVTYSQIGKALGNKHLARAIGNALHNNPSPDIFPCFKVLNSKGELAKHFALGIEEQRKRLEAEGIQVINYRVDLQKYQWKL